MVSLEEQQEHARRRVNTAGNFVKHEEPDAADPASAQAPLTPGFSQATTLPPSTQSQAYLGDPNAQVYHTPLNPQPTPPGQHVPQLPPQHQHAHAPPSLPVPPPAFQPPPTPPPAVQFPPVHPQQAYYQQPPPAATQNNVQQTLEHVLRGQEAIRLRLLATEAVASHSDQISVVDALLTKKREVSVSDWYKKAVPAISGIVLKSPMAAQVGQLWTAGPPHILKIRFQTSEVRQSFCTWSKGNQEIGQYATVSWDTPLSKKQVECPCSTIGYQTKRLINNRGPSATPLAKLSTAWPTNREYPSWNIKLGDQIIASGKVEAEEMRVSLLRKIQELPSWCPDDMADHVDAAAKRVRFPWKLAYYTEDVIPEGKQ